MAGEEMSTEGEITERWRVRCDECGTTTEWCESERDARKSVMGFDDDAWDFDNSGFDERHICPECRSAKGKRYRYPRT